MKKVLAILLTLALTLGLAACSGDSETPATTKATEPATTESSQSALPEGQTEYRVAVTDAAGTPYTSGVIVRFMQNGSQVSMQVVNEEGVAIKALPTGEYAVELQFTDKDAKFHYETEGLTLTAQQTELSVIMSKAVTGKGTSLFAYSLLSEENIEHTAYAVELGCTYVTQPPFDAVVLGSLSLGQLLRFREERVLNALAEGKPVCLYTPGLPEAPKNRALSGSLTAAQRELKNWGVVFSDGQHRHLITAQEARAMKLSGRSPGPGAVLTPLAKEILEGTE